MAQERRRSLHSWENPSKNGRSGYLINEKWYKNKLEDKNDEAQRIIITAAKLVMEDITSKKCDSEYYPYQEGMLQVDETLEWLFRYLRLFLQNLVKSDKQVAFGQAITQAFKLRSCLSPVLLGIGVDADHMFGSEWLVNFLSRFGFRCSYNDLSNVLSDMTIL